MESIAKKVDKHIDQLDYILKLGKKKAVGKINLGVTLAKNV